MNKKKILLTLGGGGHTAQMINLTKLLGDKFEYEYIVNSDDDISPAKIIFPGKILKITRPRRFGESALWIIPRTIKGLFESYKLISKSKADAIISAGPGMAFPLFIWARLFGKKTIFIETWSRVSKKSLTGKLCYPLSKVFFVQWPEMKKVYPKAIYAGRLG